jgi:hypothetical protein
LVILAGAMPSAVQAFFYAMQAASALGITLGLGLIVLSLFRREHQTRVDHVDLITIETGQGQQK